MLVFSLTGLMLGTVSAKQTAARDDLRQLSTGHHGGAEDSLQALNGSFPLVMVVTATRSRNIRPRKRDIREQLGDVEFLDLTAEVSEKARALPGGR